MSIGRQGFVGRQITGSAVSVPWIGKWVEAYFADNSSQFQQTVQEPRPYGYATPTINGRARNRPTPLGAFTSEFWDIPVHDVKNSLALFSNVPNALFYFDGATVDFKPVGGQIFPYVEAGRALYGGSTFPAVTQFTITAADIQTANPLGTTALLHFAIYRGSVTDITSGISRVALAPTVPALAVNMPYATLPAEYTTITVSVGDVIEISQGAVISSHLTLRSDTRNLKNLPVTNNGFDQPRYDYMYSLIVDRRSRIDYRAIMDAGSPTSMQGVQWVNAIYPDVPAYKMEFDIFVENPEFYLSYTYQGGAGITSYGLIDNRGTSSQIYSHYNTQLPQGIQPRLAANTWHTLTFEVRPINPAGNPNGNTWAVTASLNGLNLGEVLTKHPDTLLATAPTITLNSIYITPSVPMLMRNFRLSYWERL